MSPNHLSPYKMLRKTGRLGGIVLVPELAPMCFSDQELKDASYQLAFHNLGTETEVYLHHLKSMSQMEAC
jgi:hypothetical protein